MSNNVELPALGESVTEGTVTRWLKNVGDTVSVDEPLLEVSTDKVDTEVPSPFEGVLEQILVQEDEDAEVGQVLAVIGDGSGSGAAAPAAEPAPAPAAESAPVAETPAPAAAPAAPAEGGAQGGEEITLPALGESVTEGTITRWLKNVGDTVEVDEPLVEVSTDKVDTEVPSPVAGVITAILVQEDEDAEVGQVLAVVGGSAPAAAASPAPAAEPAPAPAAPTPAPAPAAVSAPAVPAPSAAPQSGGVVTPLVRKLAAEKGVDLSTVTATGEGGRIRREDVLAAAPASNEEASASEAVKKGGYVTPVVRKLAAENNVDLSTLSGTGVGGRIRKEDVLAAAEASKAPAAAPTTAPAPAAPAAASTILPVSPLRGTTEKASRLRQIIAERMVEALQTQAQLTTVFEVDITNIVNLRTKVKEAFKAKHNANLTFLSFYSLAATEALKAYPKINGVLEDKTITYPGTENIGIAVDTERGLLVPVIKNAGDLDLVGFAQSIADLGARTRDNKVKPDELSGATFTITNTGSGGALFDTPIVPVGTSAILGTGTMVKRPAVVKGADGSDVIAIRYFTHLSISYDHRLVDGADASRFLSAVKARIEEGKFEDKLGL
jgi:2-oxoglutarate dehydrogenase E2 component (dihydrolipoamide succinyltransferase)